MNVTDSNVAHDFVDNESENPYDGSDNSDGGMDDHNESDDDSNISNVEEAGNADAGDVYQVGRQPASRPHHKESKHRSLAPEAKQNLHRHFRFSLDVRSPALISEYLPRVLTGIREVAERLNIAIPESNYAWLAAHGGRFQTYLHTGSEKHNKFLEQQRFAGLSDEEIKPLVETSNHVILDISPRFCNSATSVSYKDNMEHQLKQIWNFFAILGRYESMIPLLAAPPPVTFCPSITPQDLQLFLLHKYSMHNTPLCPESLSIQRSTVATPTTVKDCLGNPVHCEGTCDNPNIFHTVYAAVQYIHSQFCRHGRLSYTDRCDTCFAQFCNQRLGNETVMCDAHGVDYLKYVLPRGKPTCSQFFQDLKKSFTRENDKREYVEKHASPLLPSEIMKIHSEVMKTRCDLWDFQNYTMLLGAIHHAGRFEGFSRAKHRNFNDRKVRKWFESEPHALHNIAQKVREKGEARFTYYKIEFNDDQPKLCYLRHLLVFVHCTGTAKGFLFTDKATLKNPHFFPGDFPNSVPYTELRHWLIKFVKEKALGYTPLPARPARFWVDDDDDHDEDDDDDNDDNDEEDTRRQFNISTHMCRSTFYLIWNLGNGTIEDAMAIARHTQAATADKYNDESSMVREYLRTHGEVGETQPIYRATPRLIKKSNGALDRLRMTGSGTVVETLAAAAKLFVEQMLGVNEAHSKYKNPLYLLSQSYSRKFTPEAMVDNRFADITATLASQVRDELICLFNSRVAEAFQRGVDSVSNLQAEGSPMQTATITPNSGSRMPRPVLPASPTITRELFGRDNSQIQPPNLFPIPPLQPATVHLAEQLIEVGSSIPRYKFKGMETLQGLPSALLDRFLFELVHEMIGVASHYQSQLLSTGEITTSPDSLYAKYEVCRMKILASTCKTTLDRYVNDFSRCLLVCHQNNVAAFRTSNPSFSNKPNTLGCPTCRALKESKKRKRSN